MSRFVAKRLAAVEVRGTSNQRELNAGRLRTVLGLPAERTEGRILCLTVTENGEPQHFEEGTYTLYDSREGVVTRGPEWRLYAHGADMWLNASEGDLLVLTRPRDDSTDLWAVICGQAGPAAAAFEEAVLAGSGCAVLDQFRQVHPRFSSSLEPAQLALQLVAPPVSPAPWKAEDHPIFHAAMRNGRKPIGRDLARAAITIAEDSFDEYPGPDILLHAGMEVESELYFAIERELGQRAYVDLLSRGGSFEDVLTLAMSTHQARKSRRGNSLQNHFAYILDRHRLPYSEQCATEPGERPDFIVPGCDQYHNPDFPAARLRMISCKSVLRDRWRQVLHEAARIPIKYQLTVDAAVTAATIGNMAAAGIEVFVPEAIKQTYQQEVRSQLQSVAVLVAELERAGRDRLGD